MRITYRKKDVKNYWRDRWNSISIDKAMQNTNVYPLKYSEMAINGKCGKILEAGCGPGRLLRYYHERGYDFVGIDYIDSVVSKLKSVDSSLNVSCGDIKNLEFDDESIDIVLAFGIYHNLEFGLEKAINETFRVLAYEGVVCASFRANNIQNWLSDKLFEITNLQKPSLGIEKKFHKANFSKRECSNLFLNAGFKVQKIIPVSNMPLLYKIPIFRSKTQKHFYEGEARSAGYQLSPIGFLVQNMLMKLFPAHFCNLYVVFAVK